MKWHELNHIIGNSTVCIQFHGGQSLVLVEKFRCCWENMVNSGENYTICIMYIQWKSFTETQYNDLLRQITSSSSSSSNSRRRSLLFDWQQYIAGVWLFFPFLFFFCIKYYALSHLSSYFFLLYQLPQHAYFILKLFWFQACFFK